MRKPSLQSWFTNASRRDLLNWPSRTGCTVSICWKISSNQRATTNSLKKSTWVYSMEKKSRSIRMHKTYSEWRQSLMKNHRAASPITSWSWLAGTEATSWWSSSTSRRKCVYLNSSTRKTPPAISLYSTPLMLKICDCRLSKMEERCDVIGLEIESIVGWLLTPSTIFVSVCLKALSFWVESP